MPGTWTRPSPRALSCPACPAMGGPTVPTLCAACVPTQPNWAELRHAQRDNDGEKLVTQRASAALSEPEQYSRENRLASFVISRSPVRLRRVALENPVVASSCRLRPRSPYATCHESWRPPQSARHVSSFVRVAHLFRPAATASPGLPAYRAVTWHLDAALRHGRRARGRIALPGHPGGRAGRPADHTHL